MILLTCEQCDKSLRLRDELAGKRIKCPGCGRTLTVPLPDGEEAAAAPPPRAKAAVKPTKPSRSRDDDEDEGDRPRKSTEDDGPAKPHIIFLILGLVLGLGGLAAMAFFIYQAKEANDKVNGKIRDKQHEKQAAETKVEVDRIESEIDNISNSEVTTNGIIAGAFALVFVAGIVVRGYYFVKMKRWQKAHPNSGKKKKPKKRRDEDEENED